MSATAPHPRHPAAASMLVIGAVSVIAGGLVAAVTGPLDLAKGSWLAAYLVLVQGVAQYVMGWVRLRSGGQLAWLQLACWNAGNATVIVGTLVATPLVVDAGSVLLVVALVAALGGTWNSALERLPLWAYRLLLVVLAVSIPVGMVLSHVRNS